MGFTWTKEQKTTPEAQKHIGALVKQTQIRTMITCYKEFDLSNEQIAEKLGWEVENVEQYLKWLESEGL